MPRHERRWEGFGFLAPLLLFALIVFDIPLLIVVLWSFTDPVAGFPSLGTYVSFVESGSYARIIWRTFLIASEVTIATALFGYPLAYWISRLEQRSQLVAIGLVTMTFWVSILVRTYAWIVMLGNGGILNRWLQSLGIVSRPVEFLYNEARHGRRHDQCAAAVSRSAALRSHAANRSTSSPRRRDARGLAAARFSGGCSFRSRWRRWARAWS